MLQVNETNKQPNERVGKSCEHYALQRKENQNS